MIEADGYDPRFDLAVREWARASPHAAAAVARADRDRTSERAGTAQIYLDILCGDGVIAAARAAPVAAMG